MSTFIFQFNTVGKISDKIKLRPFQKADIPVLAKLLNNKMIWDNVRDYMPHPYSESDATEFIGKVAEENPQNTFAITYQDQLSGCIGIHPKTDVYRLSAEIGYWIGQPYWGNGIATEAVNQIVDYGLNELNLLRIEAGCFSFNKASQKVLLKAGFQKEATLEKAVIKNGKICDEILFALIKKD